MIGIVRAYLDGNLTSRICPSFPADARRPRIMHHLGPRLVAFPQTAIPDEHLVSSYRYVR